MAGQHQRTSRNREVWALMSLARVYYTTVSHRENLNGTSSVPPIIRPTSQLVTNPTNNLGDSLSTKLIIKSASTQLTN